MSRAARDHSRVHFVHVPRTMRENKIKININQLLFQLSIVFIDLGRSWLSFRDLINVAVVLQQSYRLLLSEIRLMKKISVKGR